MLMVFVDGAVKIDISPQKKGACFAGEEGEEKRAGIEQLLLSHEILVKLPCL